MDINLTELRRLLNEATPRPWSIAPKIIPYRVDGAAGRLLKSYGLPTTIKMASVGTEEGQVAAIPMDESSMENAALIVAAINALPVLIDALSFSQAAVNEVRELARCITASHVIAEPDAYAVPMRRILIAETEWLRLLALASADEAPK